MRLGDIREMLRKSVADTPWNAQLGGRMQVIERPMASADLRCCDNAEVGIRGGIQHCL